jgi:hypothetical protein
MAGCNAAHLLAAENQGRCTSRLRDGSGLSLNVTDSLAGTWEACSWFITRRGSEIRSTQVVETCIESS